MPFKDGTWTSPTPTELAEFTDRLVNSGAYESPVDMPDEMKSKIVDLMQEDRIKNRFQANQKLYNLSLSLANESKKLSIILPVYNALHLVKKCVASIKERTLWPYELIIINDASTDKSVKKWLDILEEKWDSERPLTVLHNSKNRGFAATVNRGIRQASGHYICLMNSDVIVTDKWATKMTIALEANPSNVIVNPCTNNTALIEIPMQPGASYLDMNRALERTSNHDHPEIMPTGFCFMFRKNLIDQIGYFDEAFINYGEETDFWFKSLGIHDKSGKYIRNRAVMADDCYMFHERGSSFTSLGQEKHLGLRRGASERFHSLHPAFREWRAGYDPTVVLETLREPLPGECYTSNYKYNIAWVVKTPKFCGGMKFIADIVNELIENNVNAKVCVIKQAEDSPETYLGELHTAPIFFDNAQDFVENFNEKVFKEGILIAAVNELVPPVGHVINNNEHIHGMQHIQSYDPSLVRENPAIAKQQNSLYGKLPFAISSSKWVSKTLEEQGIKTTTVLPGVEKDIFHFGDRSGGDDRFTVLIPLIPDYWFKGLDRAVSLANELFKIFDENGKEIRILAYGVNSVPASPRIICLGNLSQARIATLLQTEIDIFVEPSYVHSYGMPAAEALASGVNVFSWDNKGIKDISEVGHFVYDNETSPEDMAKEIFKNRENVWHPFHADIPDRRETVTQFIDKLEDHYSLDYKTYRINVVTPHARKHGGPTTIINLANILQHLGHEVNLVANYHDFSKSVLDMCHTNIHSGWENPPECDLIIINSDNPFAEEMMANQPNAKKAMLKLSHNARFKIIEEGNLRLPHWDHIMTSTDIMKQAAMNCHEGWKHVNWPGNKVSRIGWYHYSHPQFNCPPKERIYGDINKRFVVGTLIHPHPLKGSKMALAVMEALKKKYGENVVCVGVGECDMNPMIPWLSYFQNSSRHELARIFRQLDIWIGASHTEGLGRMPLEVMSSGVAVVNSDTGTEFLEHEKNCLLYPIEDAQKCGETVDRLIKDPTLRNTLTINGYDTACKQASPEEYIATISKVIDQVMEE